MKSFMPKGIDLNGITEKYLCSACVLQRCSEFCGDAIQLKRMLASDLFNSIYEKAQKVVANKWQYIKEHGGENELS